MANEEDGTGRDTERENGRTRGRQRGGSPSAIASALSRDPHPGPQHWGGPRPRRADPDTFFPRRFPRPAPED
ncbi:calcium-binding protein [Nocardiopsis sp. JB363]|uniref:calcium-binding protein n=1 Tax=Nocardiopsis sp. JB363 TaxID=1434837 RepID=UPI000B357A98|nr:calcium-binding protein [Nocardiopsis sp. JB363]